MKKRIWSLLVAVCMALSLLPVSALAAEERYLALGDSITAGYGLADMEACFTRIVAAERGYHLTERGVNGYTASDVLEQLESGALDEEIAGASLITLTIGGNDMLAPLYELVSRRYNSLHEDTILPEEITTVLTDPDATYDQRMGLVGAALDVLKGYRDVPPYIEGEAFAAALEDFAADLKDIMACIRSCNAAANVVITTQYHPYRVFADTISALDQGVEAGAKILRETLLKTAAEEGFLVADVYEAFAGEETALCNASAKPMDLDFHPNAAGHARIAEVILALELPETPALPETPEEPEEPEDPEEEEDDEPTYIRPSRSERAEKEEGCDGGKRCPAAAFTDVDAAMWYHEAVDFVVEKGLMKGVSEALFAPDLTLSRAMTVTILHRLEGSPDLPGDYEVPHFADVTESWYDAAVRWAAYEGIVNGRGDGTFAPDDPVTREQLAAIVYRYAQYKEMDVSVGENTNILSYEDVFTVSEYAIPALQWSCGSGVMRGEGGYLNPAVPASRALVAQSIHTLSRLMK